MTSYLAQANTGSDQLASVRTVTKPAAVTTEPLSGNGSKISISVAAKPASSRC